MIPSLPEDIYVTIFNHLSLHDVLSMRKVCRAFNSMTRLRGLWISFLRSEIWAHNIPVPQLDVDRLDAPQLEKWVMSSLRLHRNWTSTTPITKQRRYITTALPQARIASMHFTTLDGRSCLLSFSLTNRVEPRMLAIECWELSTLKCKARRTLQWFGGYAVNSDPTSLGLMAIRTPHIEVLGFDPYASDPESAFTTLFTLSAVAKSILSLTGTTIIFRSMDGKIKMLDILRPLYEIHLEDNTHIPPNQPDSFQAIVEEDYALILRPKTLALYSLETFRTGRHSPSVPLSPLQVHEFPWRIDSCCMERQTTPSSVRYHLNSDKPRSSSFRPPRPPATINILIRFSSLFPWPVNMLHHLVLYPDSSYLVPPPPSAENDNNSESPTLTDTLTWRNINPNNLPYEFPPVLSQMIVSPVRLFAITDMVLGPYGTAVWLDSHTEDFFYHGDVGQRLAGVVVTPSPPDSEAPEEGKRNDDEAGDEDRDAQDESPDESHATAGERTSTQMTATIVFGAHESDDWTKIAIDEGHGRVAVGAVNGEIMIDDYAQR
ncbi:hypothetical protein D9757_006706 [Collybiopsis confluens]|uniref:F-box domain-containing protein n=1 Tax=Collybiopsis confluens TaxID=2823264 RepID=A0A8H5HN42_9AGAR|nr:hypothetical protein D9757_006706 [Collybiopsis confluens]